MSHRTAVTTVTFYDLNKADMAVRADLALQTIKEGLERNCGVFVIDGGSTDEFVQRAKGLGARVYAQEGRGISLAQQQGIRRATNESNPDFYLLIEPEKAGLLGNYFDQIMAPILDDSADIVLVGRTDESMHTMTKMQRLTETKINSTLSGLLGLDADFCMAPRIWTNGVNNYFTNYTPTKNWDLFHGPVIDAKNDGKRIVPVRIPFEYPRSMIAQEEGIETYENKRINQLMEVVDFVRDYSAKTKK